MDNQNSTSAQQGFVSIFLGAIKLLRPKQWIKNGFVLAPLVFAGEFLDPFRLYHALLATALFCVASSIVYIINDIQDIERDRKHPTKSKTRPLAVGTITVSQALMMILMLFTILVCGAFQNIAIIMVIAGYMALNVAYTFFLKHQPVIDIFTIAIGFVLRIYAGAMALTVPVSSWMFVSTLSLALYLAAIKRRQELLQSGVDGRAVLEKYSVALVDRYAEMSATCALVFYSLFVMSTRPGLVMTIPFVLYGLFRYWYIVEMYDAGESPTDVLLKDWQLMGTVAAWVGVCVWNIWPAGA